MENTKFIQSIVAYKCRICKKYHHEDLLIKSDTNENPIFLEKLLKEFFSYIKECRVDKYTGRAIMLSGESRRGVLDDSIVRIHIQPNAGKALENFTVVNYHTNETKGYKGEDHSAIYSHNVVCYLNGENNVFIFHHYGQSGCKTAFLNTLNDFLSARGLRAHFDVLMSNSMMSGESRYVPEKLSLITTYTDLSSDKAENVGKKTRKKTEKETIIALEAPRAKEIKGWLKDISQKEPTIDELKNILIKDNYPVDFEDAKVTLKFGKVRRSVSLSEFTGLMAEYDVTDKLKLNADGSVRIDSLYEVTDEYALQFFD